ncbi:MAG TPA: serine hydroxymethyltransferase [Blattabacteriaceae bacterium]
MTLDEIIFHFLKKEEDRQVRGLELIASENYVSTNVLKAMGSILTNKYAEGGKRYYGVCEIVDKIERIAIDRAKKLFHAEYVNVKPHSGSQANAAVYMACLNPGDKILGFDLTHGGHLPHGSYGSFSGKIYRSLFYGLKKESGLINYEQVENLVEKEKKIKLIICGASSYSRDIDYSIFRKTADRIGAILMADISHTAGLIAKGFLNNPFPHCHIVTSTTNKTLRGPIGGMILLGKDFSKLGKSKKISQLIRNAVFTGFKGGENVIAAKAVSFREALTESFERYVKQVVKNAKKLAKSFVSLGYKIISNGTENHCMLLDLSNKNITGIEAEQLLATADITVNKNMIPFDNQSPFVPSGIRIGTSAISTRGLKDNDMEEIANWIDEVLRWKNDSLKIDIIKKEINNKMRYYPLFKG